MQRSLLPHTQLRIQAEIERALREENSENSVTAQHRSISKKDIEQLSNNFAGILTGQVVVE